MEISFLGHATNTSPTRERVVRLRDGVCLPQTQDVQAGITRDELLAWARRVRIPQTPLLGSVARFIQATCESFIYPDKRKVVLTVPQMESNPFIATEPS